MARGKSTFTDLICSSCKETSGNVLRNYTTVRNKKTFPKIERNKFCPRCRKHTSHVSKDTPGGKKQ
jgi:large subunit ribosomal protein L33